MQPVFPEENMDYDPLFGFSDPMNPNSTLLSVNGLDGGGGLGGVDFDPSTMLNSEIRKTEQKSITGGLNVELEPLPKSRTSSATSLPTSSKVLASFMPTSSKRGQKRNISSRNMSGVQQSNHKTKKIKPAKPGQPRPPGCNKKTMTTLTLFWKSPKDSGVHPVDSYQVQKREFVTGEKSQVPPWKDIFPKQGYYLTTYTLEGLAPGTLTQFRVKAHNKIGWGKFSRASDPFPTEIGSENKKRKIEGTVDPAMIQWDVPKIRLGRGAFGIVYRSAVGGYRGTTVAVKIERSVESYHDRSKEEKEKLSSWLREVQILSSLRHPNLVLFMGACQCEGRLYILTEYMSGGSLENAIYRPSNPLKDRNWLQSILAQVASAMEYLHSNIPRITHRDLKPANVLLDKTWVHAKVCDFGFARMHKKEIMSTLTKFAGTTPYMAPEALGEEDNVSAKVDVYSFGVMAAEALIQERPFPKYTNTEVMKAVCIRNERPYELTGKVDKPVQRLIEECWHTNPDSRPVFATVIKHLSQLGWKMV